MAVFGKIIQECRPDFVNAAHVRPIAKLSGISWEPGYFFSHFGAQPAAAASRTAFRQACQRCPESVQRIRDLPQQRKIFVKPVIDAAAALTALVRPCFSPICSRQSRRERSAQTPAPKEQPPRKLSGKRTA